MSGLFDTDDNWDQPMRVLTPAKTASTPAWLGTAMVRGPAQTQGSKRGFVHPHLKRVVIVDDNDRALKSWRQELVDAMVRTRPEKALTTPVAVHILIYVPRPQQHYRTNGELKPNAPKLPASGKDIDKVARAVLDAGQIACWWCNDARCTDLVMRRRYDDGIGERTWVWAYEVSEPGQEQPELPEVIEDGEDD